MTARALAALALGAAACGRVGFDELARDGSPAPDARDLPDAPDAPDAAPASCAGLPDRTPCDDRNACTSTSTCLAEVCTPSVAVATCDLADSETDFAETQRANGWMYGFYRIDDDPDRTYDAATDFRELLYLDAAWRPPDYTGEFTWAYLMPWGGHPDSTPVTRPIRRWIATTAGPATARLLLRKADASCGDGVEGQLYVDGVRVWSQAIAFDDSTGLSPHVPITLEVGSTVDYLMDALDGDACDTTDHTMAIVVE